MKTEKQKIGIMVAILFIISISGVIFISNQIIEPTPIQGTITTNQEGEITSVLYISDYDNGLLMQALILDPVFDVTKNTSGDLNNIDYSDYDCLIIEDVSLDTPNRTLIQNYFVSGGGLIIIMGPNLQSNPELLIELDMIEDETLINIDDVGIMIEEENSDNVLVNNIEWNSAPESNNLTIITPKTGTNLLVEARYENIENDGVLNSVLVGEDLKTPALISSGDNKIILTTMWLIGDGFMDGSELKQYNNQIFHWFYFNYFFYASMKVVDDQTPEEYSKWIYSPVPHTTDQIIIGIIEISLILIAIITFAISYKRSRAKSQEEYLAQYAEKMKEMEKLRKAKLKEEELEREKQKQADWEDIGTHRQFSGFLFGMFGSIILMIPQLVLTGFVFARYIMPYPFIGGMYDFAKQMFQALWVLFDMGTSVALAKFFAQYRIEKPEKSIRYIQIFIWFQILTGCIQTAIVGFLGSFYFPASHLASQSWLFILNSFIQFPGWFMVLVFVFQGMQRTDLQLITNILQVAIFDLVGKYLFIWIFRIIFANIPQYGDAFGALVGYCIGQWLGEVLTFLVCAKLYKKLGFHMGTIFRVDFGLEEFKEVMNYGSKFVIGAVLVPLVHMIQAWLLSIWIFNYNAEWGYYSQVLMLTQVAAIVNLYAQGIMSGISEAHSHDAKKLLELNLVQGFKISYYVSFFLNFTMLIVLPSFISGVMGSTWEPGIKYIPFMIFRALFEPATWMGDKVFQGTGFTKEMSISWVVEQGSRLVCLLLFMNPAIFNMQMWGLLLAWTISLILKVLYQWIVIRKKICRFNWYPWKTFIGNIIATLITVALTLILKIILESIFGVTIIVGLLLFVVGILGFMPIYSLLTGYFGAWDSNTIREFDRASDMVTIIKPLARMMYSTANFGAKHSFNDLHNKNVIDIYDAAIKEARNLTAMKKELIL